MVDFNSLPASELTKDQYAQRAGVDASRILGEQGSFTVAPISSTNPQGSTMTPPTSVITPESMTSTNPFPLVETKPTSTYPVGTLETPVLTPQEEKVSAESHW